MKLKLPYGWPAFAALLTWPLAMFLGNLSAADAPKVAPVDDPTRLELTFPAEALASAWKVHILQFYGPKYVVLTIDGSPGPVVMEGKTERPPWTLAFSQQGKIILNDDGSVDLSEFDPVRAKDAEIARLKAENAALKKQLADTKNQLIDAQAFAVSHAGSLFLSP